MFANPNLPGDLLCTFITFVAMDLMFAFNVGVCFRARLDTYVCVCVPETALSARYEMMLHVESGFLLKTLIG